MTAVNHLQAAVSILFAVAASISGYNVSPVPNAIFREPGVRRNATGNERSLFGLAVHLTKESVFIGAPRAITYSKRYNAVNDTGLVFRCDVHSAVCENYLDLEDRQFSHEILMSGQYFGATLGGLDDENVFVACSPRMTTDETRHAMVGACFSKVNGTTYNQLQAFNYRKSTIAVDTALEGFVVRVFQYGDNRLGILTGLPAYNSTGSTIVYGNGLERGILLDSSTLEANGYFGYSVGSMLINGKMVFLAGAPRSGKVFLFEVGKEFRGVARMKIHDILSSDSFGSYYGYSLCTEDLNGDGLVDLLVGAPFQSRNFENDHGAVFVYINKGLDSQGLVSLEAQTILESSFQGNGQFGYSIATLGDINRDGYNDIAVGAPFEENGAIYIFHGSKYGIKAPATQVLRLADSNLAMSMFGAFVAKAVDIDRNGYNDIAIGAPNGESVYLFRTYPIIRPKVTMNLSKSFISIENATVPSGMNSWIEDEIMVEICYFYESLENHSTYNTYDFSLKLLLDSHYDRAKVAQSSIFKAIHPISEKEQCITLTASIYASFRHLSIPIKFKLQFAVVKQNTTNEKFCKYCVIQEANPQRPAQIEEKIIFKPNCEEQLCIPDLQLNSTLLNFNSTYVLNSTKTLELLYEISNAGESAYGTWLEIDFSQDVQIVKTMDYCDIGNASLNCLINNGQRLQQGMVVIVNVSLDATVLEGVSLDIEARLYSDGIETNAEDNSIFHEIKLERHSQLAISETYNPPYVNLDTLKTNMTAKIKITLENYGPSNVKDGYVSLYLPTKFKGSNLIEWKVDDLKIFFEGKTIDWSHSSMIFIPKITHTNASSLEKSHTNQRKGITISCSNEWVSCSNISFYIMEIPAMNELLSIDLQLITFPDVMQQMMPEEIEILLFHIPVSVSNSHNHVTLSNSGSLVFFRSVLIIPLWLYVASAVLGIKILASITYALNKNNFFKRMSAADMEEKITKNDNKVSMKTEGSIIMIIGNEQF